LILKRPRLCVNRELAAPSSRKINLLFPIEEKTDTKKKKSLSVDVHGAQIYGNLVYTHPTRPDRLLPRE